MDPERVERYAEAARLLGAAVGAAVIEADRDGRGFWRRRRLRRFAEDLAATATALHTAAREEALRRG